MKKKLLLALCATLFSLVMVEVVVRVMLARKNRPQPRYVGHRYLGYSLLPNYSNGPAHHNSDGFRGEDIPDKQPGEYRIACLGGSTTYNTFIADDSETYPGQLQQILKAEGANVRVMNCGGPGWTTTETLLNLQLRVLDLKPDLLIVYHAINDVHSRLVDPEFYVGDNSGYRVDSAETVPFIVQHSMAAREIMTKLGMIVSTDALVGTLDHRSPHALNLEFMRQKQTGSYPSGVFKKQSAEEILKRNPPVFYRRNLQLICDIAQAADIPVVLVTFCWMPWPGEVVVSDTVYVEALEEHNTVAREIGKGSSNAHLFDLAATFPKEEKYYHDGRHNTPAGARLRAEMIAEFLKSNGLDRPASPQPKTE